MNVSARVTPAHYDRGRVGRLKRLPKLETEAYGDFCEGMRKFIFGPLNGPVMAGAAVAIEQAKARGQDLTRINDIRAVFDPVPAIATRNRLLRSAQEMMWRGYFQTFHEREQQYLDELKAYDRRGPGSVTYDLSWDPPTYTKEPIHIQPGGYGGDPIAGYWYHYGSNAFFIGMNDQDEAAITLAQSTKLPADGQVRRVLDIGCSLGQVTVALKEHLPQAEVTGLDVHAAMVRYAHRRAVDLNADVHFVQRDAADTRFPDNHFDIVSSFILFHEVPTDAVQAIVKEMHRILRPGGVFNVFDFPTNKVQPEPFFRYMMEIDGKDNCEPFSWDFTSSNFVALLEKQGFKVELGPDQIMIVKTYFAEKT
jgi:SAM-dependent methyltransferase